jgi:hypothetical protein
MADLTKFVINNHPSIYAIAYVTTAVEEASLNNGT